MPDKRGGGVGQGGEEEARGAHTGLAGACKTTRGPFVCLASVPGFPHFVQAARLLAEAGT